MKPILFFFCMAMCTHLPGKDRSYTGSTPANSVVKNFLGINPKDSIDFIRWQLQISDENQFQLTCTYGIGKPNTNGFINEKKVELKGSVKNTDGALTLIYNNRSLAMRILNDNIMHILDTDQSMMKGNGGWSYTLNSINAISTTVIHIKPQALGFNDSIILEGRTPCKGMEEILDGRTRTECYKKKWLVKLYKANPSATSGIYKLGRNRSGTWKLNENASGRTIYSLEMGSGRVLDLLHIDEKIVYIMDGKGGIFVGDHDFSYSLNRRI